MQNKADARVRKRKFLVRNDSLPEMLTSTTAKFCQESSLHGLKNIAYTIKTPAKSKGQRLARLISVLIWVVSLVLGICFASVLMQLAWDKFQNNPTITTIETNTYPIWNLRFPAVTLCNINKVFAPAAANFSQRLISEGLNASRVGDFLAQLTKLVVPETITDSFEDAFAVLDRMNYTTERMMYELMEPCGSMIRYCSWLGKATPCRSLFRVVTSSEGFCCAFNYQSPLDPDEVDTLNDFIEDAPNDPVYRVSGAGPYVGLEALIRVGTTESISYTHTYYGVSVMVHGSEDFPQLADRTAVGQPGDDVTVGVVPTITVSTDSVRGLPVKKRSCYFEDEVKLRTTIRYSYKLCIAECVLRTIYRYCKCLPFYYAEVHLRSFSGPRSQCLLSDVACLRTYRSVFASLQPDGYNDTRGTSCNHCLPSCSSEQFTTKTIIAHRKNKRMLPSLLAPNLNMSNYVSLRVHYRDITCQKYRRDVILTWDALLATFGGIFSLCLGGSIISVIEIVYYFTFRLFVHRDVSQAGRASKTILIQRSDVADKRKVSEFVRRLHEHFRWDRKIGPYID